MLQSSIQLLERQIAETLELQKKCFANQFNETMAECDKYFDHSVYHILTASTVAFLRAILTYERVRLIGRLWPSPINEFCVCTN